MLSLLRDRLRKRLSRDGDAIDYVKVASEVLGIHRAPPALARRLVEQALVIDDRQEAWRAAGERIVAAAPATPGVYVLRDGEGAVIYVGKAVNLRRRLQTHFAERRWKAIKPAMARAAAAEWQEVGSDLEAIVREARLIQELRPPANVQVSEPSPAGRAIPSSLERDVIIVLPSIEGDSAELIAARADGDVMIQRTRRNGADSAVHARRLYRFFNVERDDTGPRLAPLVFSWLAGRGRDSTRLDPHDARSARDLAERLAALLRDDRLFSERLDQRG